MEKFYQDFGIWPILSREIGIQYPPPVGPLYSVTGDKVVNPDNLDNRVMQCVEF